jgi:aryl-alcohol dehydrogenase (NADP+)
VTLDRRLADEPNRKDAQMTTFPRRNLGRTGFAVHPLNLGGNVFGWTADQQASFAVLDAYREAGGNFVDTADVYSKWVPGHVGGESETILGAWLADRRCRDEFVIATKVGMGGPDLGPGLKAEQIRRGCEASLRRLRIDRIDLYYAHRDDPDTPLDETLGAFDALVRAGKVRAIGASNYAADRLREALDTSASRGLASYAVLQPEYNLVARDVLEGSLAELCSARGIAVCTYYALASGFLTGKYRPDRPATGARAQRVERYLRDPMAMRRLETLEEIADELGASAVQVALAWLLSKPFVTAAIASATTPAQVLELMGSVLLALSDEQLHRLDR